MKRLLTATALTLALATAPYTWAAETHNTTPTTTLSVQQNNNSKILLKPQIKVIKQFTTFKKLV